MLDGTVEMTVCTLSFPNYGWMIHNVQENVKSQKIFMDYIAKEATNLQKEDVKVRNGKERRIIFPISMEEWRGQFQKRIVPCLRKY
jgi:hypothetical protein